MAEGVRPVRCREMRMMKLEQVRVLIRPYIAATALVLGACSSATDTKRSAANISAFSGSAQIGFAGSALAQPLVVQVTASDGTAVSGTIVDFTVQSGTATVNPGSATTDATGKAQTVVTAGASTGTVVIVATVHATSLNAIFTATVQVGADASCTGVTPISLAVGDVRPSVTGTSICLTNAAAAEYL